MNTYKLWNFAMLLKPTFQTFYKDITLSKISLPYPRTSKVTGRFEKVHTLNNYLFSRKCSSETVAVLKKYLSSRSSCLEKVLLTRSTSKKEVAASDN